MLQTPIDLYCERLDPSYWAEPINALSNLGFVIAALWAWQQHRRAIGFDGIYLLLCLMAGSIGVGSFLFHTHANVWSQYSDIVPIWSFVVVFVLVSLKRVFGYGTFRVIRIGVIAAVMGYLGFSLADTQPGEALILNGSLQYAPALFFMGVMCVALYVSQRNLFSLGLCALALFFSALVFRTIDLMLCTTWALGTHFMWHLLNALMVYCLLRLIHRATLERKISTS